MPVVQQPAPPALTRTQAGVAPGPASGAPVAAFDVELSNSVQFPELPVVRPATTPAQPPPVPGSLPRGRPPLAPHQMTAPLPGDLRPPLDVLDSLEEPSMPEIQIDPGPSWSPSAADSNASTRPEMWAAKHPATTQPMAPTTPIAPPTAPTMIVAADYAAASTARGMGVMDSLSDASPATTARGFQPPQAFPAVPHAFQQLQASGLQPPAFQPPSTVPGQPPPPAPPPRGAAALSPPLPQAFQPPRPPAPQAFPQPPQAFQPQFQAPQAVPPLPRAPVLVEVTPRGLGIATVAGFCEELIRRNARVPTEARKLFSTSRDRQDLVRIVVCQGESRRLDQNVVIGDLILQGLPPRPRGETSIEVTFALDASGVLHVRARDAQTGAEQRASLNLVGDVAQEDVAASRERLQQLRR
jgi:hypothetical protein